MVVGWLVKVVVYMVLGGLILIEGGSPWIARAQADDIAHTAADEAALLLGKRAPIDRDDVEAAERLAATIAGDKDAEVTAFSVDADNVVHVSVRKQAISFVMKNVEQAKDYYEVEVDATAKVR